MIKNIMIICTFSINPICEYAMTEEMKQALYHLIAESDSEVVVWGDIEEAIENAIQELRDENKITFTEGGYRTS